MLKHIRDTGSEKKGGPDTLGPLTRGRGVPLAGARCTCRDVPWFPESLTNTLSLYTLSRGRRI